MASVQNEWDKSILNSLKRQSCHHIETSQLICSVWFAQLILKVVCIIILGVN